MTVLFAVFTVATPIVKKFDNTAVLFVGGTFWELENEDEKNNDGKHQSNERCRYD